MIQLSIWFERNVERLTYIDINMDMLPIKILRFSNFLKW